MKRIFVLLCLSLVIQAAVADSPTVPNTIRFAGLNLKLTDKARKKIQAEVNALTRHPRYFQIKVDRLQIYFPIIERIFNEEGLPEDFKYLVLQESALISDAVSSSNAVGFWQFKKDAALEVGLHINRSVDERLNIVASTRGAAKYLKKNNRIFFDNWVHALLAYQQGPGGAQKIVKKKYRGSSSMPIDGHTHWYVIKFLAHKIAFEQVKTADPKLYLVEYYEGQGKSLKEISVRKKLDSDLVVKYNKWLKRGKIPGDKSYAVMLPYEDNSQVLLASGNVSSQRPAPSAQRKAPTSKLQPATGNLTYRTRPEKYPVVGSYKSRSKGIKINGIRGIRLKNDMDLVSLEELTGITAKRLLYYNDLSENKRPKAGELWYLKPKRSKAHEPYHIVEQGENLWQISQKYGIKISQLRRKNRISKRQTEVKVGRVLWLQQSRPTGEPAEYQVAEAPKAPEISDSDMPVEANRTVEKDPDNQTENAPNQPTEKINARAIESTAPIDVNKPIEEVAAPKLTNLEQKVHVVQSGETLYGISKKYELTIEQLQHWNGLTSSSVLSVGQQLRVSNTPDSEIDQTTLSEVAETKFSLHKVQPGETLYQIARDYQATIRQLMEWNEKTDFNLRIGEELKIREDR